MRCVARNRHQVLRIQNKRHIVLPFVTTPKLGWNVTSLIRSEQRWPRRSEKKRHVPPVYERPVTLVEQWLRRNTTNTSIMQRLSRSTTTARGQSTRLTQRSLRQTSRRRPSSDNTTRGHSTANPIGHSRLSGRIRRSLGLIIHISGMFDNGNI